MAQVRFRIPGVLITQAAFKKIQEELARQLVHRRVLSQEPLHGLGILLADSEADNALQWLPRRNGYGIGKSNGFGSGGTGPPVYGFDFSWVAAAVRSFPATARASAEVSTTEALNDVAATSTSVGTSRRSWSDKRPRFLGTTSFSGFRRARH